MPMTDEREGEPMASDLRAAAEAVCKHIEICTEKWATTSDTVRLGLLCVDLRAALTADAEHGTYLDVAATLFSAKDVLDAAREQLKELGSDNEVMAAEAAVMRDVVAKAIVRQDKQRAFVSTDDSSKETEWYKAAHSAFIAACDDLDRAVNAYRDYATEAVYVTMCELCNACVDDEKKREAYLAEEDSCESKIAFDAWEAAGDKRRELTSAYRAMVEKGEGKR